MNPTESSSVLPGRSAINVTNADAGWMPNRLIWISSLGTIFEWYDFFLYGAVATVLSRHFFPADNATASFLLVLGTFGAGFAVRPLGAAIFGSLGDRFGRKRTFVTTMLLMGLATAAIGILPTYENVGLLASVLLVLCRLLQGFALGGEYGGAAIFVAEHAPASRRGLHTSWIQLSAAIFKSKLSAVRHFK